MQGFKCRGVNLGGWLVLEKWITPSLFEGLVARDETSYCVELGKVEATQRLQHHWKTYITREDFAWLASVGIDAVRLPVGHWLFGADYPYHPNYGNVAYPFVEGGVTVVDQVFEWASEYRLRIILDFHAAPGCQNGFDNGGIQDICEWHTQEAYIAFSLDFVERLASRYHHQPALLGIEILNEPRWDVPTDILSHYTRQAYHRIRRYCSADKVAVIFHDGFRDFREYDDLLQDNVYQNLVLDIHRYQCFTQDDVERDIFEHINKTVVAWKQEADKVIEQCPLPVYCGEWSLGLDLMLMRRWVEGNFNHSLSAMDSLQMTLAYRAYAATQLLVFEKYLGWFFWTYRTENMPAWSFRDVITRGWLPDWKHNSAMVQLSDEMNSYWQSHC